MKYLLQESEQHSLELFLRKDTLIALDYDGTLAPIAPRPEDARMRDTTRALLARVAKRYPVVIITGRSRTNALHLMSGISVLEVIGSHGLETPGSAVSRFLPRVVEWRAQLVERLRAFAGITIEDKRYSLSVHYRHAQDPGTAKTLIDAAARNLKGARIVGGKKVVNVVPEEAPDKGLALLSACARLGCGQAVFAGDDDTDEAAFAVGRPGQIFSIRVGQASSSKAGHYLRSQEEIDTLLGVMLDSGRTAPATPERHPPAT